MSMRSGGRGPLDTNERDLVLHRSGGSSGGGGGVDLSNLLQDTTWVSSTLSGWIDDPHPITGESLPEWLGDMSDGYKYLVVMLAMADSARLESERRVQTVYDVLEEFGGSVRNYVEEKDPEYLQIYGPDWPLGSQWPGRDG